MNTEQLGRTLLRPFTPSHEAKFLSVPMSYLGLALGGIVVVAAAGLLQADAGNEALTVIVTRRIPRFAFGGRNNDHAVAVRVSV